MKVAIRAVLQTFPRRFPVDRNWFSKATDGQIYHVLNLFLEEVRKPSSFEESEEGESKPSGPDDRKKTKSAGPVQRLIARLKKDGWLATNGWPDSGLRERIYPLLWKGIERGFVFLRPPRDEELANQIKRAYHLPDEDHITVVLVRGQNAVEHVTRVAATIVLDLIVHIWESRRGGRTHLAWGAGTTSRLTAKRLSEYLEHELWNDSDSSEAVESWRGEYPPLTLHALTSGFLPDPMTAPLSFFAFFDRDRFPIESVGLFSQAVVNCKDYDSVKEALGVEESFQQKALIDVIISSLASKEDEHSLFKRFLGDYEKKDSTSHASMLRYLEKQGWCGDVQYLPFSSNGPIPLGRKQPGVRAVTLFELDELVERIRQGKQLVLVSAPCHYCAQTRASALVPLLKNPTLKVWSHLVLDVKTAEELLALARSNPPT